MKCSIVRYEDVRRRGYLEEWKIMVMLLWVLILVIFEYELIEGWRGSQ